MSNQCEIRLSGSGGQGLILGGIILAEAALNDGKNAVQSQSYGPEARGGASKAEVIISHDEINYPKVRECDILLSLTQVACDKYLDKLKKDGVLILDENVKVPNRDDVKVYSLPIIRTATEKIGKPMVSNIVALAVINSITNVTSNESLEKAVLKRVPRGTEEINTNALKEGFNLVRG